VGHNQPGAIPAEHAAQLSLLDALLRRRSRRFARGMDLDGGPLAHRSPAPPEPLTLDEAAALAFAACGITGHALAELPFAPGAAAETGDGNILMHFVARTIASGDAAHAVTVFVTNDEGAWMLRRPQDYPRAAVPYLVQAARERRLVELYGQGRVRIADRRCDVPREIPYTPSFNKWSANQPGTTTFLPVAELTALAINITLTAFGENSGYYVLDERNSFQPAGVTKFARSRGGHLDDDPAHGRVATVGLAESWLHEFAAAEQGAALQNLGLMAAALGLGGFSFFAAHPYAWMQALGFRMQPVPLSRAFGMAAPAAWALRALGRDTPVPTPVGLERNGEVLIRPFCPPYYPTMEAAVLAFVEYKCAEGRGTQHDGGAATAWRDGATIQAGIPRYSDQAIAATVAYCEYIHRRYGRFPSAGPFRTLLAYQAHRPDSTFYERFYRPDAL
jgi:hypothetical protein